MALVKHWLWDMCLAIVLTQSYLHFQVHSEPQPSAIGPTQSLETTPRNEAAGKTSTLLGVLALNSSLPTAPIFLILLTICIKEFTGPKSAGFSLACGLTGCGVMGCRIRRQLWLSGREQPRLS